MADSLSGAILFVTAVGVAGAVGAELVAERGDHRGAVGDHVVAGVAARVFTARDGFHTDRCSPDNGSPSTIPRFFWMIATTFFVHQAELNLMGNSRLHIYQYTLYNQYLRAALWQYP